MSTEAASSSDGSDGSDGGSSLDFPAWPESPEAEVLRLKCTARLQSVTKLLLKSHAARQASTGWRGAAAVGALALVGLRVGVAAVAKGIGRALARQWQQRRQQRWQQLN